MRHSEEIRDLERQIEEAKRLINENKEKIKDIRANGDVNTKIAKLVLDNTYYDEWRISVLLGGYKLGDKITNKWNTVIKEPEREQAIARLDELIAALIELRGKIKLGA